MSPRTTKFVCEKCSADTVQRDAMLTFNTGEFVDTRPVDTIYCPNCDETVSLLEVSLTEAEQVAENKQWTRRAHAAIEAMIVDGMGTIGARELRHIYGRTFLAPDAEHAHLPHHDVCMQVADSPRLRELVKIRPISSGFERVNPAGAEILNAKRRELRLRLIAMFDRAVDIWHRAHDGLNVTPDSLQRLADAVDRMQPDKAQRYVLTVRRIASCWEVVVLDSHKTEHRHKGVVADGVEHYLCVAAERCIKDLRHKVKT